MWTEDGAYMVEIWKLQKKLEGKRREKEREDK